MRNTTVIVVFVVAALVVLLFGGMWMMGFGPGGMMGFGVSGMMGRFGMPGFGFNPFGRVISLVFWALIVGGVVMLIAWLAKGAGQSPFNVPTGGMPQVSRMAVREAGDLAPAGGLPLDILKLRYAKGEITKEQFEESKRVLGV